ncbi:MAG: hypothetical protein E7215_17230 [Clostridium sulfidigenes]|uniref:Uncharacterized protein n=1 Tax=Clostridium sulfidigenes TaxID=318464 RepID=A0A927W771_9CLOT|nr:hypothetical protein [Clostridium sulfidigenes]
MRIFTVTMMPVNVKEKILDGTDEKAVKQICHMGIPVKTLIGLICHDKIVFSEYMSSINVENNN